MSCSVLIFLFRILVILVAILVSLAYHVLRDACCESNQTKRYGPLACSNCVLPTAGPKGVGSEVDEGGFAESGHSSVVEVINICSFETAFLKDRIERKFSCRSIHPQLTVMLIIICYFCFLNAVMRGNSLDCSDYCLGPFESRGNSWGAWNAWISSHTYLNVCAWGVPLCELYSVCCWVIWFPKATCDTCGGVKIEKRRIVGAA